MYINNSLSIAAMAHRDVSRLVTGARRRATASRPARAGASPPMILMAAAWRKSWEKPLGKTCQWPLPIGSNDQIP